MRLFRQSTEFGYQVVSLIQHQNLFRLIILRNSLWISVNTIILSIDPSILNCLSRYDLWGLFEDPISSVIEYLSQEMAADALRHGISSDTPKTDDIQLLLDSFSFSGDVLKEVRLYADVIAKRYNNEIQLENLRVFDMHKKTILLGDFFDDDY